MSYFVVQSDRKQWLRCRPWIEDALPYTKGTHSIEDIEDGIADGRFVFWAGNHSAVITEFIHYPKKKVLNYFLFGGRTKEAVRELVKVMEPRITQWAKRHGCSAVAAASRPGLERIGRRNGFQPAWRVIYKDI